MTMDDPDDDLETGVERMPLPGGLLIREENGDVSWYPWKHAPPAQSATDRMLDRIIEGADAARAKHAREQRERDDGRTR